MADVKTDTDALDALVKLFVDAFNDVSNVFGSGKTGLSFSDYGSLLTDVMHLAGKVKELPEELKALDAEHIAQLVQEVEQQLELPNDKARAVCDQIVGMVANLLTTTLRQAEGIAATIKS